MKLNTKIRNTCKSEQVELMAIILVCCELYTLHIYIHVSAFMNEFASYTNNKYVISLGNARWI